MVNASPVQLLSQMYVIEAKVAKRDCASIRTRVTIAHLWTELGSHSAKEVFKNSLEM